MHILINIYLVPDLLNSPAFSAGWRIVKKEVVMFRTSYAVAAVVILGVCSTSHGQTWSYDTFAKQDAVILEMIVKLGIDKDANDAQLKALGFMQKHVDALDRINLDWTCDDHSRRGRASHALVDLELQLSDRHACVPRWYREEVFPMLAARIRTGKACLPSSPSPIQEMLMENTEHGRFLILMTNNVRGLLFKERLVLVENNRRIHARILALENARKN